MGDTAKEKASWIASVITTFGIGTGGAAAVSYYIQEAQGKAIEKMESKQDQLQREIYLELKEINIRLSTIEGRLTK